MKRLRRCELTDSSECLMMDGRKWAGLVEPQDDMDYIWNGGGVTGVRSFGVNVPEKWKLLRYVLQILDGMDKMAAIM